jgi:hypothetical protein
MVAAHFRSSEAAALTAAALTAAAAAAGLGLISSFAFDRDNKLTKSFLDTSAW